MICPVCKGSGVTTHRHGTRRAVEYVRRAPSLEIFVERLGETIVAVVLLSILGGCSGFWSNPTSPSKPATTTTVYEAGTPGVSLPTVIRQVRPSYTAEAIANRIQGTVLLAAVVLPDGTVGEVTVIRSLDTTFGLDAQAVQAARQWLFNPGMKDGVRVAVRVSIEMTFTLR